MIDSNKFREARRRGTALTGVPDSFKINLLSHNIQVLQYEHIIASNEGSGRFGH